MGRSGDGKRNILLGWPNLSTGLHIIKLLLKKWNRILLLSIMLINIRTNIHEWQCVHSIEVVHVKEVCIVLIEALVLSMGLFSIRKFVLSFKIPLQVAQMQNTAYIAVGFTRHMYWQWTTCSILTVDLIIAASPLTAPMMSKTTASDLYLE